MRVLSSAFLLTAMLLLEGSHLAGNMFEQPLVASCTGLSQSCGLSAVQVYSSLCRLPHEEMHLHIHFPDLQLGCISMCCQ